MCQCAFAQDLDLWHLRVGRIDMQMSRLEVKLVGLRIACGANFDRLFFFREQLNLQGCNDRCRDVILHGKNVADVPIITLSPEMAVPLDINKLRIDPHLPAGHANAAGKHEIDIELLRDLGHATVPALERK